MVTSDDYIYKEVDYSNNNFNCHIDLKHFVNN